MPVNANSWKKLAWVPRETKFDNDNALIRIRQWAAGSQEKYASAFLWNNGSGAGLNPNNYRLPIGDIYNGKLTLVPRAIFSAATIVSGAHGGLEGVVSDAERNELKRVLTQIYDQFREKWNDRRQIPPWLRGGNEMGEVVASVARFQEMPVADIPWNEQAVCASLWDWADGDLRKYRQAFLWWDEVNPDVRSAYKYPVAAPVNGTLTLVSAAVTAVHDMLTSTPGVAEVPAADIPALTASVQAVKAGIDQIPQDGINAALLVGPEESERVFPSSDSFSDPNLQGPTPLAVTADGRVMGHMFLWNSCHAGIGDKCVMAPKSATGYKFFTNGSVLTSDGKMVRVGKITMGTGHADIRLGYVPAADHYDNTGTAVAIVAAGEDRFGGWVNGVVVPEATPEQIQQLRRSPISGDWRRINGNLELVAALAVNTPGFPIVSMTAAGDIDSLCAAGVLAEDGSVFHDASVPLPKEDAKVLEIVADLEKKVTKLLNLSRKAQLRTLMKKDVI